MIVSFERNKERLRRKRTIRKKVAGTPEKPRLTIFRSLKHISSQVIDDTKGTTLVSASTLQDKDIKGSNVEAAKKIGKLVAEKALEAGIKTVVFDRSGYLYHGRVKAFADAAREAGLKF
jgi:large subunit ribosomal protein L18